MLAPMKASTAPTKNEVTATIGRASSPARSARAMNGAGRMRRGIIRLRNSTTISRPLKAKVWSISSPQSTIPRPMRSSRTSTICWRGGRGGSTTRTLSIIRSRRVISGGAWTLSTGIRSWAALAMA